jgi:hypothetical protein
MAELINLNKVKKRIAKQQATKQADANRVQFGRSKSQRTTEQARAKRANELLEQHRIEGEDAS